MPRIFDNIEHELLPALKHTISNAFRADFCVGYFNLRGWNELSEEVERFTGGENYQARILIGMQRLPHEDVRKFMSVDKDEIDNQTRIEIKKKIIQELRKQLTIGFPTDIHEKTLQKLIHQIENKKVRIKLFLGGNLHAKLYLLYRNDEDLPRVGFLGSSNLTMSGLKGQGELNIDVTDHDASQKLSDWFNKRWNDDDNTFDVSEDIKNLLNESWARESLIPPYHIYLKIAYHLSQEARTGLEEFSLTKTFEKQLTQFQAAAVKIAAHHLNKRNGVLIGDVVGFGKTIMATALASIFENDFYLETLIICPKNLIKMWEDYVHRYRLHAKVISNSVVQHQLEALRRYRLLIIDESHNFRNREGKRYKAIKEYIEINECRVILLSATPYNKTYLDLSNQLRLFVHEDLDLGIRPERLIKDIGEVEFNAKYQVGPRTIGAFERSEYADDWRELMRLYLIRRTRSFIKANYGKTDPESGRIYLEMPDNTRFYFPDRLPKTLKFPIDEGNPDDQYAQLFSDEVVDTINHLNLPRYGLGNYIKEHPSRMVDPSERKKLGDLSKAGKRLMGFCRTNLFKRLESCGHSFLLSLERHALRNYIFLYAFENNLPLPIGTQGAELLDARINDEDEDIADTMEWFDYGDIDNEQNETEDYTNLADRLEFHLAYNSSRFMEEGKIIYQLYQKKYSRRFQWINSDLFDDALAEDLKSDADDILWLLNQCGKWKLNEDKKLFELERLIAETHPKEKIIIFSQFADTVEYLECQLKSKGIDKVIGVTGDTSDPTEIAWHFSPKSNEKADKILPESEYRILLSTDVLSEGQNLQDCYIVVNYDLPWAIIRLIQRAGRVDRIGQESSEILCYSFLPADGVERIIRLRERVHRRLLENGEVLGTDEAFFEDDQNNQSIIDLYNERSELLEGEDDRDVDLASYAYQIWKNAIDANPTLEKVIQDMPDVVFSAKQHTNTPEQPTGVLVYARTSDGNDALSWVDEENQHISDSQYEILQAAQCSIDEVALPRHEKHHVFTKTAVEAIKENIKTGSGGQLGRPSGARFRSYSRLKGYIEQIRGTLWDRPEFHQTLDDIFRYPLRSNAKDTINRQMKAGISDERLANLLVNLRQEGLLSIKHDGYSKDNDVSLICSLGLRDLSNDI